MKWQTPLAVGGITMPVTTIVGQKPGPAVLITAGIHGAEYVGIETARRLTARNRWPRHDCAVRQSSGLQGTRPCA